MNYATHKIIGVPPDFSSWKTIKILTEKYVFQHIGANKFIYLQ